MRNSLIQSSGVDRSTTSGSEAARRSAGLRVAWWALVNAVNLRCLTREAFTLIGRSGLFNQTLQSTTFLIAKDPNNSSDSAYSEIAGRGNSESATLTRSPRIGGDTDRRSHLADL